MNFLAHQHLSYPDKNEMIGNFIGDYVKGKQYQHYSDIIAKGIVLHRRIDAFTDSHPITKSCRQLFAPYYGKYAGIIVDMVYDYALASQWTSYASMDLSAFTQEVYDNLFEHYEVLPDRVQYFLPKMKKADRLLTYESKTGILNAIQLMTQYTSLPNKAVEVELVLRRESGYIVELFNSFYPEIQDYVSKERDLL